MLISCLTLLLQAKGENCISVLNAGKELNNYEQSIREKEAKERRKEMEKGDDWKLSGSLVPS